MTPTGVHPLATIFPMMAEDELADLAADIEANGLLHPIILDADGQIVDGRNRQRACEIAAIQPEYEQLNGRDATAFIVSANLARRNLTKAQQAMALAMIYPEPEKGGRGKRSQIQEGFNEPRKTTQNRLSQARAILRYSKPLAEQVIAGAPFDDAFKQVEGALQAGKAREARLTDLRAKAPDVAALIDDERLTVEAGLAELAQRQRQVQSCIAAAQQSIGQFLGLHMHVTVIREALNLSDDELALVDIERSDFDLLAELPDKELAALAAAINDLKRMKTGRKTS